MSYHHKTYKENRLDRMRLERITLAEAAASVKQPFQVSDQIRIPYMYTELCPDPRYRRPPEGILRWKKTT